MRLFGSGSWSLLLVLFSASAQPTVPDPNIEVKRVPALGEFANGVAYKDATVSEMLALARSAKAPASSPEAKGVLAAAMQLPAYLAFELPAPDSTAVLTHAGEDIAVARGRFKAGPGGATGFVLWNEPVSTSLLLQVPPKALQTPEGIEDLLRRIFIWRESVPTQIRIYLGPLTHDGRDTMRGVIGWKTFSQFAPTIRLAVSGVVSGTSAWLSVTFGNEITDPPDMRNIAERFPPLRDRVPGWSKAKLLAAVDHGGRAESNIEKARERDQILMQELLKRPDLTLDDFRALTRSWGGRIFGAELPLVIKLAAKIPGDRFVPATLDYFQSVAAKRPPNDPTAQWYISYLNDRELDGYCDDAVRFLTNRAAVRDSLRYAAKFCHTREAFDAVEGVENKPPYSKDRAAALDQIGKSLPK